MISVVTASLAQMGIDIDDDWGGVPWGQFEVLVCDETQWASALQVAGGEYVMFAAPGYAPHPGWLDDAIATARAGAIPTPVLWTADGDPVYDQLNPDWHPANESLLPFLSRDLLELLGDPDPTGRSAAAWVTRAAWEAGVPFYERSRYAFTVGETCGSAKAGA